VSATDEHDGTAPSALTTAEEDDARDDVASANREAAGSAEPASIAQTRSGGVEAPLIVAEDGATVRTCERCSAELPDEAVFCVYCGVPLAPPADPDATAALPAIAQTATGFTGAQLTLSAVEAPRTWTCTVCEASHALAARFCADCGAAAPSTRLTCAVCSDPIERSAKFCTGCGAKVAAPAGFPVAPATVVDPTPSPNGNGNGNGRALGGSGTVVDGDGPDTGTEIPFVAESGVGPTAQTAAPPRSDTRQPGLSTKRILIGLGAAGALVAAAVVAALLLFSGGNTKKTVTVTAAVPQGSAPAPTAPAVSAVAPADLAPAPAASDAARPTNVETTQAVTEPETAAGATPAALSAAVIDMTASAARQHRGIAAQLAAVEVGKSAPLRLARGAGSALADAARAARVATTASFPNASPDEQTVRRDLLAALAADAAFGRAVATLPVETDDLKTAQVQRVMVIGQRSDEAFRQLRATLAAAAATTPALGVPPAAGPGQHIVQVSEAVAEQARLAAEMRSYVSQMESILSRSSGARSEIGRIQGNLDRCDPTYYAPDMAYSDIQGIAAQREGLAVEASGLNAPTAEAAGARDQLVAALQTSADANYLRAQWVSSIADWWYTFPVGCYGSTPRNGFSDQMSAADSRASGAKAAFVGIYNAFAPTYGGRRWSGDSI
jgi:hypothetical protein